MQHYTAGGKDAEKARRVVYVSGIRHPVNHLDALPLLLDSILGGEDVTLINESHEGHVLLGLAAGCLTDLRTRVLWAAEVLPDGLGMSLPSLHPTEPPKAGVPDDEWLTKSFQALTVRGQTCDRIVLLVRDAQALQHPALRYIQFVSRSSAHLQLVFCGTRKFFDLLDVEEFAWLRARLKAGLVLTLAAAVVRTSNVSRSLPPVADVREASVAEAAEPPAATPGPALHVRMPSRRLWVGAAALLGLGGAAWLVLGTQNGEADRPATSRQAAAVSQPPTTPKPPLVLAPKTQVSGSALDADTKATVAAPSGTQSVGPGSPPSIPPIPAFGAPEMPTPQTKAGTPEFEAIGRRVLEPLPAPAPSLVPQSFPATPSRAAAVAVVQPPEAAKPAVLPMPEVQVPGTQGSGSPATANNPAVTAAEMPEVGPASPSKAPVTPPSMPASGALVTAGPQTKAGMPEAKSSEPQPPLSAGSLGRQSVPAAPSRSAAAAPGGRTHRSKEVKDRSAPLPAEDHWVPPQAASAASEPPGGSPQFIGSYATGADGVRVFHLEP